jgi:hypothetical protein
MIGLVPQVGDGCSQPVPLSGMAWLNPEINGTTARMRGRQAPTKVVYSFEDRQGQKIVNINTMIIL